MQVQSGGVPTPNKPNIPIKPEVAAEKAAPATGPSAASASNVQVAGQKPAGAAEPSGYLKVLSRLENMHQKGELPEGAVENFLKAVTKRLEEGSEADKKSMVQTPEAKALEIKDVGEVVEKLEKGFEDKANSGKVFALLKQSTFVEMMNGKETKGNQTYGANGQPAANSAGPTAQASVNATAQAPIANKAAASSPNAAEAKTGEPVKKAAASPQQAIAAMKAMQAQAGQSADAPKAKIAV